MHLTTHLLINQTGNEEWVLFNTLTGAVDAVDKKGYEQLKRIKEGDFSAADREFLYVLQKRGYLFENEGKEDELLNRMLEQYRKKLSGGSIKALICPTFACNLRCTYCFQGDLRERVPVNLGREEITLAFGALDEIVRIKEAPGAQIDLSGGEPFLLRNYELTDHILHLASERNYPVGITTNGVNLSQFRPILEKHRGCLKSAQITIDGPERVHNRRRKSVNGSGTFDKIVEGVDLLLDLGIATIVRVNVDSRNVGFLPELAQFISNKGWNSKRHFRARLAKVENHAETQNEDSDFLEYKLIEQIESFTAMYDQVKESFVDTRISRVLGQISKVVEGEYEQYRPNFYYCEATSTGMYVFGADGLLYPCGEAAGNPSFAVGRFLPKLEIDQEKLSYWQHQNIVENPECYRCPIASLCGGGCPYQTLRISDESRMRLCESRRKQAEKYMELHASSFTTRS